MKPLPLVVKDTLAGLVFALFWSSASVTTKLGIVGVEPLVLACLRYTTAGFLMLLFAYFSAKNALPHPKDRMPILVLGLLNITFYSAFFVLAIEQVAASIGSLSLVLNSLFITLLSALYAKKPVQKQHLAGLTLGILGVLVAVYPFLLTGHATLTGLLLLLLSRVVYSGAAVYYAQLKLQTSPLVVNTWQTLVGGLLLVPLAGLFHSRPNHFTGQFWLALAWLIVPIAIVATQLWLYLLKKDATRASFWQFLCPIFGILYAHFLLQEPLSVHTLVGGVLVGAALYVAGR